VHSGARFNPRSSAGFSLSDWPAGMGTNDQIRSDQIFTSFLHLTTLISATMYLPDDVYDTIYQTCLAACYFKEWPNENDDSKQHKFNDSIRAGRLSVRPYDGESSIDSYDLSLSSWDVSSSWDLTAASPPPSTVETYTSPMSRRERRQEQKKAEQQAAPARGPPYSNTLSRSESVPSNSDTPLFPPGATDSPTRTSLPGFSPGRSFLRPGVSFSAVLAENAPESLEKPGFLPFVDLNKEPIAGGVSPIWSEVYDGTDPALYDVTEDEEYLKRVFGPQEIRGQGEIFSGTGTQIRPFDSEVDDEGKRSVSERQSEVAKFHEKGEEIFDFDSEDERRVSKTRSEIEEEAWEAMIDKALDPHDGLIESDDVGSHSQEDLERILRLWNRGAELLKENVLEIESWLQIK
jgi:hypothetical protein